MASLPARPDEDGYDRHYVAKLWSLVPEVYRSTTPTGDGVPEVLRGLIEVLGLQMADIRRKIDRIWDDQSIELADAWAVEAIGELLATRGVAVLSERERRVDVANTIHYRRRRGTPLVLQSIADDLTKWDAALIESYTTLLRTVHLLDPSPSTIEGRMRAGRLSGTPRGALPNLRRPLVAELTGGPFDEYAHTVDVRLQRGAVGRHRLDGLNIHQWRATVMELTDTDPLSMSPALPIWTLDPSGRDVALFGTSTAASASDAVAQVACGSPAPWDMPGPITCRLFEHQIYALELEHARAWTSSSPPPSTAPTPPQQAAIERLVGMRFPDRATFVLHLESAGIASPTAFAWFRDLLELSLVKAEGGDGCGRSALLPTSIEVTGAGQPDHPFRSARLQAADLSDLTALPTPMDPGVEAFLDPHRGRIALRSTSPPTPQIDRYHVAVPHSVGAGTYGWSSEVTGGTLTTGGGTVTIGGGTTRFGDNRTYDARLTATATGERTIAAAEGRRPYLLLRDGASPGASIVPDTTQPSLLLEGLWIGVDDTAPADLIVAPDPTAGASPPHWKVVRIRHCTLDPGGSMADGTSIGALRFVIDGDVDELIIESSILGGVVINGTVGSVNVCDTVIDGVDPSLPVLIAPRSSLTLCRVTIVGGIECNDLHASDCLVAGRLSVSNTQAGCFRFSAANGDSRFPPRYRTWPPPGDVRPVDPAFFTSIRFGDHPYLDLLPSAPQQLRTGSERGEQMGAYEARRLVATGVGLRQKLAEYAPARVAIGTFVET